MLKKLLENSLLYRFLNQPALVTHLWLPVLSHYCHILILKWKPVVAKAIYRPNNSWRHFLSGHWRRCSHSEIFPSPLSEICHSKERLLLTDMSSIAICSKPACNLRLEYGANAASLSTTQFLLNAGARIILVNATLIPTQWINNIEWREMPHFCIATQEPFHMHVAVLLLVRLSDLCIRAWFKVFHSFSISMF